MIIPLTPDPSPTEDRNRTKNAVSTTADDANAVAVARQELLWTLQLYALNRQVKEFADPLIAWVLETAAAVTVALEELGRVLRPILVQYVDSIADWFAPRRPKPIRYTHSARQDVPRLKRGKHTYQLYVRRGNERFSIR